MKKEAICQLQNWKIGQIDLIFCKTTVQETADSCLTHPEEQSSLRRIQLMCLDAAPNEITLPLFAYGDTLNVLHEINIKWIYGLTPVPKAKLETIIFFREFLQSVTTFVILNDIVLTKLGLLFKKKICS